MPAAPVCSHDFYAEATIADPLPCYRAMLEAGPVVWLERNGLHAISHFEELTAALRNTKVFISGKGVSLDEEVNARLIGSTLNSDPPIHDETRAITATPLMPKALEAVRPRIEAAATELVERMVARGSFDAAAELAPHLPLNIVRDLVGLSEARPRAHARLGGSNLRADGRCSRAAGFRLRRSSAAAPVPGHARHARQARAGRFGGAHLRGWRREGPHARALCAADARLHRAEPRHHDLRNRLCRSVVRATSRAMGRDCAPSRTCWAMPSRRSCGSTRRSAPSPVTLQRKPRSPACICGLTRAC